MSNYLSKLKKVFVEKAHPGERKHSPVLHHVVEVAEFAGASYAFGYLQNKYAEKASVMGVPIDLLAGIAGKVITLGAEMTGHGGHVVHLINNVGNAGIGAFFHTLGAGHGHESKTGVSGKKSALAGHVVMGELGAAPTPGNFLTASQLAAMARA